MGTQKGGVTGVYRRVRRFTRHATVPHAGNDYRPHLVRRRGLAMIIVAVSIMQLFQYGTTHSTVLGASTDVSRQKLLENSNQERRQHGQLPLQLNDQLNAAAQLKANNMFEEQYWAHESPSGVKPWYWFTEAEYAYTVAGENLAKGFYTSDSVVTAWMNSPEHRANLLNNDFSDVGFAVVPGTLNDENTMVVVALYGSPAETMTIPPANAVLAANDSANVVAQVGTTVQTVPPLVLGSITLLLAAAAVAIAAHAYRQYLPRKLRRSWYQHHGLYKATSMTSAVVVLIVLYGGGQI